MGVLGESWCFCNGGAKSERMKAAIFSGKGPATARISGGGTGFLIHRNLLLTTHGNLPSVAAAEAAEIWFQSGDGASLFPHRFFISSSVLDLTIVGVDAMDGDSNSTTQGQQPHYLKTNCKPNLDLGNLVYILGYTETNNLAISEGKVVIATDNLIKLSKNGVTLSPGSAGFDIQGNLAFMVCDPMKLATSPNTKSTSLSSSSSTSRKKDLPMQFGVPIPVICDWLNQYWEGSLDELNKPKLPIIRLMSQKSEHSCASFTMRSVFKSANEETPSSSFNLISNVNNSTNDETVNPDARGIPTPEIYESPKLTSIPVRKKNTSSIQLLDINFPPKLGKSIVLPQISKKSSLFPNNNKHVTELLPPQPPASENDERESTAGRADADMADADVADADMASTGSYNGAQIEVQSSSSPIQRTEQVFEGQNGYSSEGETTMYSAETAESRNYPSPRERKSQQVGRSQSCVSYYNRWGGVQRHPLDKKAVLEKQRSMQGRKIYSQKGNSQRNNNNNDYYNTPTVSSIMKKRIDSEKPHRPRPSVVHSSSPRWMF